LIILSLRRETIFRKAEVKQKGVENVTSVVNPGYGAEEIITLGRHTPDNHSHAHAWPVGMQRWVLGSVTERVAITGRSGADCPKRLKDRDSRRR
jgi:hypothetical protein